MIKKLCIISAYYPTANDPFYAFVGTLVEAFADMGVECHVISPVSITEKKHRAKTRIEKTSKENEIHVYCPRYIVFPSRNVFGYQTYKLTVHTLWAAIHKVYKKHIKSCDAIYSHFVDSGVNAAWLKKKTGISAFMAVGESNITMRKLTYETFRGILYNGLDGVVSVSTQLKNDLFSHDIIAKTTPVVVAPNAIDSNIFKPLDKNECRKAIGASEEDYIISFVGAYIKRKGFDKLQLVLKRHPSWKCILIGSGDIDIELDESQVLFKGRLPHEEIPRYISASDVFALPTEAEGCCNAIVEAMGCGLPVVSSNKSFNDDILNDIYSIRIDPNDVEALDQALTDLCENSYKRQVMSDAAKEAGLRFSIENRARMILSFMENYV